MRNIIFIGRPGCNACHAMLDSTIAPLHDRYPANVSAHFGWDGTVERVNRRKRIKKVPLIVVENGGSEEFRFHGRLSTAQLEGIIRCEREALTLEDVLGGDLL